MNIKDESEVSDIFRGSLYAVSAFFCMAVFGILTKIAIQDASVFWVSFIAYLTGTLLLFPVIVRQGIADLKSDHYLLLLGRAVFGTVASFCYTVSMHYIPIVNGTLLQIPLLFIGSLPSVESIFYSILAGAFLLAAQMALVTGYKYAQASQIGIYQYSSVVFVGLIDWLLWNTIPTSVELIGALLVAIAGIIVIRSGNTKSVIHES